MITFMYTVMALAALAVALIFAELIIDVAYWWATRKDD